MICECSLRKIDGRCPRCEPLRKPALTAKQRHRRLWLREKRSAWQDFPSFGEGRRKTRKTMSKRGGSQ